MKIKHAFLIMLAFCISCNDQPAGNVPLKDQTAVEDQHRTFFPVTDFLNGQVAGIKTKGVNPLKIVKQNGREDSSWVKIEQLSDEFSQFLSPEIDSTNLKGLFAEKSFLDQTVNAFTLTYDPVKPLPDSFLLQHWDVY